MQPEAVVIVRNIQTVAEGLFALLVAIAEFDVHAFELAGRKVHFKGLSVGVAPKVRARHVLSESALALREKFVFRQSVNLDLSVPFVLSPCLP